MSNTRLAVWTPLPPQRSGIADHNAMLLPFVARHANVSVVVEDRLLGRVLTPERTEIISQTEYEARRDSFDATVYHLGNNPTFHTAAYHDALRNPGVVVLHDTRLREFIGTFGPTAFQDHLREEFGSTRVPSAEDPDAPFFVRRLVETSRATIVHSAATAVQLQRRHPATLIAPIQLAAKGVVVDRARLCDEVDLPGARFLVGALGGFAAHKRLGMALRAFESLLTLVPTARMVIAGWAAEAPAVEAVDELVDELGIEHAVRVLTDLTPAELDLCLGGVDVLLDLRSQAAGGTPATLFRAIASGKPVVASDLPLLGDLPPSFCTRVPVTPFGGARDTVRALHRLAVDEEHRATAGRAAQSWAESHLDPAVVAHRFIEVVRQSCARRPVRVSTPVHTARSVTVVGDPHATTGLMEAGRAQLRQLVRAGADVSFDAKVQAAASHSLTRHIDELAEVPPGRLHPVELWLLNLNEFLALPEEVLRPTDARRYVIASWFWELPVVPVPYTRHTHRPDEIWVPSRFVQQAISPYTPRPVHIVPPLVDVPLPPRLERHDFGLPEDGLLFFFNLDANSTVARKNPWAVVAAFMRAFDEEERQRSVRLVLKCTHLEHHAEAFAELQAALKAANGILLADELERLEMNALLASIDVYVSLHRSEGFGLGMAEAMFLGKPVIGTAYSGNTDFMTAENSCQVGYRMRPITTADHRFFPPAAVVYQPGIPWADADVDQAARWMRRLVEHPHLRADLGERGAQTIRDKYSPDVAQRTLVESLERAWRTFERAGER